MPDRLPQLVTDDGSYTFFSPLFGEAFHSTVGAKREAEEKFVLPCDLPRRAQGDRLCLVDVCYGLGYNSAAALGAIWTVNPRCRVELVALEWDRQVPLQSLAEGCLDAWRGEVLDHLTTLSINGAVASDRLQATMLWGDARHHLARLTANTGWADVIFLDPFSPPKCPQLWTVEFLGGLAALLAPQGQLATYSCAAAVRQALLLAGLRVGPSVNIGRRSPGTLANWTGAGLAPLSPQEAEHLHTKAAIPYRDPHLQSTAPEILQRRQQEQGQCDLEPTSHWKKRWYINGGSS